jgi:hypothetical protein
VAKVTPDEVGNNTILRRKPRMICMLLLLRQVIG